MTDRRLPSSDQLLAAWFEDGPTTMPDRVIDVVAGRIGRQPQRPAWRNWRLQMTQFKYVATLAAVIAFAVVGYNLLPRSGIGLPIPTAVPTPAPTATPVVTTEPVSCDGGSAGCLGPLAAGTHTAANFRPRLAYTVPDGWSNTYDPGRAYTLVPPGAGYSFQVLSEVSIPEQTQPACNAVKKAGAGDTVADWVSFLTTNPGVVAEAPVPVTIGGASGFRVDFARSPSWTATCPGSLGPAVMIWVRAGVTQQGRWTDDQQESFWILDVAGSTVLITVDSAPSAAQHTADIAAAQPIIDSFQFNP